MRDEDGELPLPLPYIEELFLQEQPRLGIQRPERLVQQEDGEIADERARDSDALAHADRELVGVSVGELFQADPFQKVPCPVPPLGGSYALHLQAERHVVHHGQPWEHAVVLEDERPLRAIAVLSGGEPDRAGGRLEEAREDLQERGLPAAARSDDADDLVSAGRQRDVLEGVERSVLRRIAEPHRVADEARHRPRPEALSFRIGSVNHGSHSSSISTTRS